MCKVLGTNPLLTDKQVALSYDDLIIKQQLGKQTTGDMGMVINILRSRAVPFENWTLCNVEEAEFKVAEERRSSESHTGTSIERGTPHK